MEKIASFTVDHTRLKKGMYLSRVDAGDIVTYDIRMKVPNAGDYLTTGEAHTFEHLFATYARNTDVKDSVIYVGPMGCRTGFYLVTKALPHPEAIRLVQDACAYIAAYEGDIPGASEVECGNYLDQDLPGARALAADMAGVLAGYTEAGLSYEA